MRRNVKNVTGPIHPYRHQHLLQCLDQKNDIEHSRHVISMPYLSMKLPNQHGDIVTIKADQVEARECYTKSLLDKPYTLTSSKHTDAADANHVAGATPSLADLDPRKDEENMRLAPIKELHLFQLGKTPHQCIKIGEKLDDHLKKRIEDVMT